MQSVPSSNSIGHIRRLKYVLLYHTALVRCISVESEPHGAGFSSVRQVSLFGSVRFGQSNKFSSFGSVRFNEK